MVQFIEGEGGKLDDVLAPIVMLDGSTLNRYYRSHHNPLSGREGHLAVR